MFFFLFFFSIHKRFLKTPRLILSILYMYVKQSQCIFHWRSTAFFFSWVYYHTVIMSASWTTQKEITSQTDLNLVISSSKHVFEAKLTSQTDLYLVISSQTD